MTKAEIVSAIMDEIEALKKKNKDYAYITAQVAGMIKAFRIMKVLTTEELSDAFSLALDEI